MKSAFLLLLLLVGCTSHDGSTTVEPKLNAFSTDFDGSWGGKVRIHPGSLSCSPLSVTIKSSIHRPGYDEEINIGELRTVCAGQELVVSERQLRIFRNLVVENGVVIGKAIPSDNFYSDMWFQTFDYKIQIPKLGPDIFTVTLQFMHGRDNVEGIFLTVAGNINSQPVRLRSTLYRLTQPAPF